MVEEQGQRAGYQVGPIKAAIWMGACALMLAPLVAMQFTREVMWTPSDFVVFGIILWAPIGLYELIAGRRGSSAYRSATGIAMTAAFFLAWINLAVGIIGSAGDPANLMFAGVLGVAALGAIIARFRAGGMAYALFATAAAQAIVAAVALAGKMGTDGPIWPRDLLGLTVIFTTLWLASAVFYRRAARSA
jgi:hypothetical protein